MWCCEFCRTENSLSSLGMGSNRHPHLPRPCPGRDVLYVHEDQDGDYENLENMLVVFCVDVSGSMSVTSEVSVHLASLIETKNIVHLECHLISTFFLPFVVLFLQIAPGNAMRSPTYVSRLQVSFTGNYSYSFTGNCPDRKFRFVDTRLCHLQSTAGPLKMSYMKKKW